MSNGFQLNLADENFQTSTEGGSGVQYESAPIFQNEFENYQTDYNYNQSQNRTTELPAWLKWTTGLGSIYGELGKTPTYDPALMQEQINPLEESYKNLQNLSQEYADPNSALNQQARKEIRTQNMEGFADIADRQRKIATGEYGDTSPGFANKGMMTDAITAALKNYSSQHGERMKTSAELSYKAGSIGNILAQARQQNYYNQQQAKAEQRGALGGMFEGIAEYGWDWLTGKNK